MSVKIYKITGKLFKGAFYLRFEKGYLTGVEYIFNESLTGDVWRSIHELMPQHENELKEFCERRILVASQVKAKTLQDKIVLFNHFYKHYRGVAYVGKTVEKANLKNVPVTPDLLKVFFESPLSNFTMANYINRINITKDFARNGMKGNKHPNYYDRDYEKTLGQTELNEYHKHLRALGWTSKYHPSTGTVWKEPDLFNGND